MEVNDDGDTIGDGNICPGFDFLLGVENRRER